MPGKGCFTVAGIHAVRMHHKGKERRAWFCLWVKFMLKYIQRCFSTFTQILVEGKKDYWGQTWDLKMKHVIGGSGLLLEGLTPPGEERPVSKSRGDCDWAFHAKPELAAILFPIPSEPAAGSPKAWLWGIQRNNFAAEALPPPLWTQTSETPKLNLHLPSFFLSQSQSDMKTSKLINSVLEVSKPHWTARTYQLSWKSGQFPFVLYTHTVWKATGFSLWSIWQKIACLLLFGCKKKPNTTKKTSQISSKAIF